MPTATCLTGSMRVWTLMPVAALGTLAPAGNLLQTAVDRRLEYLATESLANSYTDTGRTEHRAENRKIMVEEIAGLLKLKRDEAAAAKRLADEEEAEADAAPWEFFTRF